MKAFSKYKKLMSSLLTFRKKGIILSICIIGGIISFLLMREHMTCATQDIIVSQDCMHVHNLPFIIPDCAHLWFFIEDENTIKGKILIILENKTTKKTFCLRGCLDAPLKRISFRCTSDCDWGGGKAYIPSGTYLLSLVSENEYYSGKALKMCAFLPYKNFRHWRKQEAATEAKRVSCRYAE